MKNKEQTNHGGLPLQGPILISEPGQEQRAARCPETAAGLEYFLLFRLWSKDAKLMFLQGRSHLVRKGKEEDVVKNSILFHLLPATCESFLDSSGCILSPHTRDKNRAEGTLGQIPTLFQVPGTGLLLGE